ncbi:aminoacyl-tRNA hydrolase [Conexibacter sp. DBS9H8]|uniref:aminoacyl-tRNA hydrolase n=1 Tax=Conexibacter sp. DBS9H8 TaxID=2937801 RepID=UPI00200C920B|nr:aminoacyl-tRNA hydrolase [Conexibacter sp. DBS9H8]
MPARPSHPVSWLIVGLGNPGAQYQGTPHNVGFVVAERLRDEWGMPSPQSRYRGLISIGTAAIRPGAIPGAPARGPAVAILCPQTYMNDSGASVGPARGELRVPPERVLVLHDEIDTPFGEVRTKFGGGLAGHNGLKSISRALGTRDFPRVRLGVGRPNSTDPDVVAAYVLGRFRQPADAVADLVDAGVAAATALIAAAEAAPDDA